LPFIHPSAWKKNSPKFAPGIYGWHHDANMRSPTSQEGKDDGI
jgi:hypothetical protein